jgi:hypothetical protein
MSMINYASREINCKIVFETLSCVSKMVIESLA